MRRWYLLAPASALAMALAASSGCSHAGAEAAGKAKPAVRTIPVTVAPLERRTVERTVEVVGSLRGWEHVTVGSKQSGRVLKVVHDMGDRVKPGEVLIELDPVDAKLAYDQAQSKYLAELMKLGITEARADELVEKFGVTEELIRGKHAEDAIDRVPAVVQVQVARDRALHNLNRQRALSKKGASTAQEMEDMENEYRSQCAAYDNARYTARNAIATAVGNRIARDQAAQALADMVVRVPSLKVQPPGMSQADRVIYAITKRPVSEGQMLRIGDAVCELVIENPLRLWTSVPERYSDQVEVGQPVRISVASHTNMAFQGKVVRINPSVDNASRTFQVETLVPNERRLLRPGGFAKATIVTDSQAKAAVVPIESIVRFAGVTKILVVEGGTARAINDITTGWEGQGWVEITGKGIPEKALVVTTGQSQLADGTPVVIRTPEPPPPPGSHQPAQQAAAEPAKKAEAH
ncbi:putative efflux pump membrane fusion protein [Aquisphaera giovannonii]|uniref:Putative efflux pump membrane fusion protein n=1 Tax=Aquisphaera giovannonii TaxID=406548 RepID=A0A5B9VZZ1_9BACT|nr:efflux RND transporter periplasmic adaptor subunit [Aquisphaera giovannonii]QEH33571.1 putative efflux pump membrane fusion protein [Aquisphaera giovannonii]